MIAADLAAESCSVSDGTFRRTGGIQRSDPGLTPWEPIEWELPGKGERGEGCGLWVNRWASPGCATIYRVQKQCMMSKCPTCWIAWAGKEAAIATRRILDHPTGGIVSRQAIVSPAPAWTPNEEEYTEAKAHAIKGLKIEGWTGFAMVYHPFRARCSRCSRRLESCEDCPGCGQEGSKVYDVPGGHWHILGWKEWSDAAHDDTWGSWIYKNIDLRNGVNLFMRLKDTIAYELSHAGLRPRRHALTWCGELSYNKIPKDPEPEATIPDCPKCGEPLVHLDYGSGLLDRNGNIDFREMEALWGVAPGDWSFKDFEPGPRRCRECGDEMLLEGDTCRSCSSLQEERKGLWDRLPRASA